MTPILVLWYLIIANPNGGLLAIPQPSRDACITQARYLNAYFRNLSGTSDTFCVSGTQEHH